MLNSDKKIEIGNSVLITNKKDARYYTRGCVLNIKDDTFTYPIKVRFEDDFVNSYKREDLEVLSKGLETKKEKTNFVKRISASNNESFIKWNIGRKNIEINISGYPINIVSLLKIILKETQIYTYEYHRKNPFKISREYNTDRKGHIYKLQIIDTNHEFELKEKELLVTNKSMAVEGKINMFIPDFLEICVERKILKRNGDSFTLAKNLDNVKDYIYIKEKPDVNKLKSMGFIIPDEYYSLQ